MTVFDFKGQLLICCHPTEPSIVSISLKLEYHLAKHSSFDQEVKDALPEVRLPSRKRFIEPFSLLADGVCSWQIVDLTRG